MIAQHPGFNGWKTVSAQQRSTGILPFVRMFSTLIKLEEVQENPCKGLEPLKEAPPAMTYLAKSEISKLLDTDRRRSLRSTCYASALAHAGVKAARCEVSRLITGVTFLDQKREKAHGSPASEELEKRSRPATPGHCFKVDYENFCERLRQVKPDLTTRAGHACASAYICKLVHDERGW